jgi:hypothetical protein
MIGRDDLLVVRDQVGVRPISTSVFGLKPALNPQQFATLNDFSTASSAQFSNVFAK